MKAYCSFNCLSCYLIGLGIKNEPSGPGSGPVKVSSLLGLRHSCCESPVAMVLGPRANSAVKAPLHTPPLKPSHTRHVTLVYVASQ